MPQAREHLNILNVLGVRRGLAAVTKIDLADSETVALAADEVRDLVRGTFLEGAPVCPVSPATGAGMERPREALDGMIASSEPGERRGPFRMPAQRAFAIHGFGTVLTGVPVSGVLCQGEAVALLPAGAGSTVRRIEAFGEPAAAARAGHRTALNVAGVHLGTVHRGDSVVGISAARLKRLKDSVISRVAAKRDSVRDEQARLLAEAEAGRAASSRAERWRRP